MDEQANGVVAGLIPSFAWLDDNNDLENACCVQESTAAYRMPINGQPRSYRLVQKVNHGHWLFSVGRLGLHRAPKGVSTFQPRVGRATYSAFHGRVEDPTLKEMHHRRQHIAATPSELYRSYELPPRVGRHGDQPWAKWSNRFAVKTNSSLTP
jgi:hypothetical protein